MSPVFPVLGSLWSIPKWVPSGRSGTRPRTGPSASDIRGKCRMNFRILSPNRICFGNGWQSGLKQLCQNLPKQSAGLLPLNIPTSLAVPYSSIPFPQGINVSARLQVYHRTRPPNSQAPVTSSPSPPCAPAPAPPSSSSPRICCCNTMLYTLAFSSVNTKLVFLSKPLNASRISAEGVAERVLRRDANYHSMRQPKCLSTFPSLANQKQRNTDNGEVEAKEEEAPTSFRFPASRAYSSRTSCSSSVSVSGPGDVAPVPPSDVALAEKSGVAIVCGIPDFLPLTTGPRRVLNPWLACSPLLPVPRVLP